MKGQKESMHHPQKKRNHTPHPKQGMIENKHTISYHLKHTKRGKFVPYSSEHIVTHCYIVTNPDPILL